MCQKALQDRNNDRDRRVQVTSTPARRFGDVTSCCPQGGPQGGFFASWSQLGNTGVFARRNL